MGSCSSKNCKQLENNYCKQKKYQEWTPPTPPKTRVSNQLIDIKNHKIKIINK